MKHPTFRGLLRLAAFLLGLALIVAFTNTFCIKTDIYAALTMAEVKTRSDIEVAFVGSSIVRDHFNAEMISKEIGKTCFALNVTEGLTREVEPCAMLEEIGIMRNALTHTNTLFSGVKPEISTAIAEGAQAIMAGSMTPEEFIANVAFACEG